MSDSPRPHNSATDASAIREDRSPTSARPAPDDLATVARVARTQLDKRLDAIEREVTLFAAQADQTAQARRVARTVRADVERARSLGETLERLLALEHQALRLEPVEVSDLLMAALSRWKIRAPQQTFELALPGQEPTVLGDGALIEQAIEGLIAWAAAHADLGDVRVSLRQGRPATTEGEGEVTVVVRCPLAATTDARPARLFDRFDAPQTDGAGELELTLARAIAERHGGRAWADIPADEPAVMLTLALPTTPPATLLRASTGDHSADVALDHVTLAGAPLLARPRKVVAVAHADARMGRYLRANLEVADFSAKTATNLPGALKLVELEEPDLIVLDLALPDDDGRDPLARILARTTAPVIALGRPGANPSACVEALDAGAADFIAQPLSVEETLARIRGALRPQRGQTPEPRQRIFTCGELVIDDAQRLVTIGGAPAQLSRTEYRLLRTLAQNLGKTLSHEALLAQVWGPAYSKEIEFIWVYIRRLRRKIEPDPARPRYILTAPGVGYRLAQPGGE